MARLLEIYVALSALSFDFVTACQDGKFAAFFHFVIWLFYLFFFYSLSLLLLFSIAFVSVFSFTYFCALTSISCMEKWLCYCHDGFVVRAILRCFSVRKNVDVERGKLSYQKYKRLKEILIALLNKTPALLAQLLWAQLQSKKASNAWRLAP